MENKKSVKTALLLALSALSVLVIGGIGGYFLSLEINKLSDDERKVVEEYRVLRDEWLYGNEEEYLADYALSGLADGFAESGDDPYTFYTPTMEDQNLSVSHLGFGITTHPYDGGYYVTAVHDGPASGVLEEGDVLLGATRGREEYYSFQEHTIAENENFLSDEEHVTDAYVFTYSRNGEEGTALLRKSTYQEEIVHVLEEPQEDNGYTLSVQIRTFLGEPTQDLDQILSDYEGKRIDRLLLDLRGNTGGYVDECERMAKLFVRKGQLIDQLVDRDGNVLQETIQESDPKYSYPEYAILIDSNTASASETFALAMRAGTDCTLYGRTSYGKGVAQRIRTYSDGSTLRFTYAYVYGPEKENEDMYDEGSDEDDVLCIHGKGIVPDVVYDTDYVWLQSTPILSSSLSVSIANQMHVLNLLHLLPLEEEIPQSYQSNYHFHDALVDFSNYVSKKYQDETLLNIYQENGCVSLPIEQKVGKESFDLYLSYCDDLLEQAIHD